MEKAINGEFALSRRQKIVLFLGLVCFLVLSIATYFRLYSNVRTIVSQQAISSITNISQLNEDSVSVAIHNRSALMDMISMRLTRRNAMEIDGILRELEDFETHFNFYSMGVLDENLTLHLTGGRTLDVSNMPQYKRAWDVDSHLSESYMPADGGLFPVNTFSSPVFYQGQVRYILIATYLSRNLTERMNINSMDGKGYTFILNCKGEVVVYPKYYEDADYNGLMRYINDAPHIIPAENGDTYFVYNGESYYAHFEHLDFNDWTIMTCAREADVFAQANDIIFNVFLGMGVLWLMILIAIGITVVSSYRAKQKLRQAVFYDELLGIGNGNAFPVFFRSLSEQERTGMVLMIFDIDKFKEFNYLYGEPCGDELLRYIVRVFHELMPEDYIFRFVSDHFVTLMHCTDKKHFIEKANRFFGRMSQDIDKGVVHPFDLSAGVRRIHRGDSFRRLVSDALIAKSTIKGIQVQQYAFYDDDIRQMRTNYMEMESDFARALRDGEFQVYYQPKYDMARETIVGAEALVRWVKKDGTIVSPGSFIPCFEASRQIIMLDEMMLESVCRQMKQMQSDGLPVKPVSVNLSRVHLRHHGILTKIENCIRESGVAPANIAFEITESTLYEDSIPLKNIIESLHALGHRVDMDDYGVGVSGPNALANNQFDVVKLDKSLVDGIGDPRREAVLKSTIVLSKTLGMGIVAEGVEQKYQVDHLVAWGCTTAQGYYFSRPVPEAEYRRLLAEEVAGGTEKKYEIC